ncbi:unnamed protein product [Phyllotreta striolata]|uniref:Uncharacterized protein n=1 Tax=Phyllotreta striolata TaxID=444603 RepID=A0A9N9XQJ2_PHYSR|nr:unnamed protein product [Phyllotreta striolata]
MKKFLQLFLLQFLFLLVHSIEDTDVFVLANDNDNKNNWCITNSTSAMTINSNISETQDRFHELSPNEIISITQVIVVHDGIHINWNLINCSNRTGPIYVKSETVCISDWCDHLNTTIVDHFEYESEGKTLFLKLQSYCNYTITLTISRDKTNWLFSDSNTFMSNLKRPHSITHLSVYSKNRTSISLRWIPPYPPTGVLKEYKIVYIYSEHKVHYIQIYPIKDIIRASEATCKLWKEFHCATITNDESDGHIDFVEVSAKNQEPDEFGPHTRIKIERKEMGPEPPYNLNYEWTDENKLFITFYHPNNTNGRLTRFELVVFNRSESKIIRNEEDYQLQYKFNYEHLAFLETQEPCSNFKMSIRAQNIYDNSNFTELLIHVPPSTPNNITTKFNYTSGISKITIHLMFETNHPNRVIILVSKRINIDELRLFETNDLIDQNQFQKNFTSFWIVYDNNNLNSSVVLFEIGDGNSKWRGLRNPLLESGTNYTIIVYIANYCKDGATRWRKVEKIILTDYESNSWNLWLTMILIPIIIVPFVLWYMKKNNIHCVCSITCGYPYRSSAAA